MKDYCQQRLLIVGSAGNLKAFDRTAEIPGATDIELLEHTPNRVTWQFVMESPCCHSSAACPNDGPT